MKVKPRVPADLADYVSHELRSPLNGIKVWAQVLVNSLDRNDDSTVRQALDGIAECVNKQAQFLDALATSQTLTRVSRVVSVCRASSCVARSAVEVMARVNRVSPTSATER